MNDAIRTRVLSQLWASPRTRLRWEPAVRIVPRFPPIGSLEQVDASLQAAVLAELASTVPHLVGRTALLPSAQLPAGSGASWLITGFTFSRPARFNDDTFAALYGAESLPTAIAETAYHVKAELRAVNAPPQTFQRVALNIDVDAAGAVDVRASTYAEIYDPDDYIESRAFGAAVRESAPAVVSRSVRRPSGECAAVFDIRALSNCREARRLEYRYNGADVVVAEVHYP